MSEKKRYFTIMIVPHSEEATYSIRVPLFVAQLVVAFCVIGLAAFFVLAYSYSRIQSEAEEARILRKVNQAQQDEIDSFAQQTQQLLAQMQELEELAKLVAERLGLGSKKGKSLSKEGALSAEGRTYSSRSGEDRVLDRAAGNLAVLQELLPEKTVVLQSLKGEVDEYNRRLAATPSIWPCRGRVTSGFGMRRSPFGRAYKFHYGIDIASTHGTTICATADGKVSFAGYRRGFGNLVIVQHGYGFQTYYAHLSRFAVSSGQSVQRGRTIGYMGRTGSATGTHLHYEVHLNGVAVNPAQYL